MHELRQHERMFVNVHHYEFKEEGAVTDYERARLIVENPLVYIEGRQWRKLEAARKYFAIEGVRRRSCHGITRESYDAWRAFVSELGS